MGPLQRSLPPWLKPLVAPLIMVVLFFDKNNQLQTTDEQKCFNQ